jgi:cytochrome P450
MGGIGMADVKFDLEDQAKVYEYGLMAFAEPELAAARTQPEPQAMYVDLIGNQPVRELCPHVYSLVRMDDILFVNKHPNVQQASKFLGSNRPAIPLGLDGAEHRKYRKLLDPVFTARRVEPLAPQVRELAHRLIDGFIEVGEVDAYRQWCEPLPSSMFLSIMGLPMDDLPDFLHFKDLTLSNEVVEGVTAEQRTERRREGVAWIQGYFTRDLDAREKEATPRDDMIGWLLSTEVDGHRLSREEILDILGLLMIAGLDTVAASLACFLSFFARHPEHRSRVVAEPSLLPSAVEELMRFESPVTDGYRLATNELTLPSGVTVPAGSYLLISWSGANLDGAHFPDPLTVDLERKPNTHIGFASGFHRCLGSHLARMEMRVALEAWHERIPDYRIEPGVELVYSGNPRAPHHLPLVWRRSAEGIGQEKVS